MMKPSTKWLDVIGVLIPPRLSRLTKYALPSFPRATTRWEGIAPGTSTSRGPEPPRSSPRPARSGQFLGAQESPGSPLKVGPGWKRIIASPPTQSPPVLTVLPVVTNGFFPSLATPPTPHIAPRHAPP